MLGCWVSNYPLNGVMLLSYRDARMLCYQMVRGYDGTTLRQGDDTPILNGGNLSWCYDTRMERYYTNLDGVDDTMDPSN